MAVFNLTLSLAWQVSVPVVPLLALETGASPFMVGLTVGASSVLPLLLGLPAGWASDRFSTRRLQVVGAVAMVAAFAVMLLARDVPALMVGQALVGLANMVSSVAAHAFIAATTESGKRDATYGQYSFVVALGNVAGPAVGGLCAEAVGPRAALVAALVVAVASLPQTLWLARGPGARLTQAPPPGVPWLDVIRPPIVRFSLIASFLIIVGQSLKASFYVLYLNSIGFPGDAIGLLLSVSGAVTIVVRPLLAWGTGRLGHARLLTLLSGMMGVGLAAVPVFGPVLAAQMLAAVLTGAAYGLSQPLTITMIGHAAPPERLGLAFAWRQMAQRGGELASPLALGLVVSLLGLEPAFWVAGGLLLAAAVRGRRFPR